MGDFIEKWRSDSKYRAKMQLIMYGVFILGVAAYAAILNNRAPITNIVDDEIPVVDKKEETIINIPNKYNYVMDIVIDDKEYKYSGTSEPAKTTITKIKDDTTTNYIYENNEYYIEDNGNYVKTTKDEVYDIVNYNYLNLNTINEYLTKATKDNDQYLVYLKDIILGNDSEEYFTIKVDDNNIVIDYTPLMKQFNNNINNYEVTIQIDEIE